MSTKNFDNGFKFPDFEQYPMFNDKNMEQLQALTKHHPESLKDIIKSLIEEVPVLLENVEDGINKTQFEKIQQHIHSLKGIFATFGASRLFEISRYMDENNKKENFDITFKLFPMLKSNYYKLEELLKERFL